MYYFACGDSITHANHAGIETISDDDKHCPVGGSQGITDYKKKGYPYYIAKKYDLKWFNYGIGGSTLTHCIANGESKNGFMTPGGRYTQLDGKVTPDYISIFFGWNDNAWGVIQHIEKWLKETYGATIYYPMSTSLIGTVASDGIPYTTQEQYNAVNAYATEHPDYFVNQFIGDKNSVDVTTWYGAWNVLLEYLILKYPFAKIMPIVPYDVIPQMKEAVRDVCGKWGVACYDFDFDASEHQIFLDTDRNTTFNTACGFDTIRDFRKASLLADGLHPNTNGYKYMSGSIGAKLMSI
jgi:lysophospholipase L1-like esterase